MVEEQLLKRSRLMYIFQAALEYLISILVAGSFLATITKELGLSDSLTGILSSIISLGCLFQLLSLSIRRTHVKKLVIPLSVVNQLFFMLLYVLPLTGAEKPVKAAAFVISILSAYLLYNIAHPQKTNWLMSLVDDHHRGEFTANKEIFSLITGMAFTFGMGAVVDRFAEQGQIRTAFIICAVTIFLLMMLHTVTMLLTVEKELPRKTQKTLKESISVLLKNKKILSVAVVFILYYISTYISVPFYGSYQIGELGLSLKYVSVITIVGSASRILISKTWGRYADRTSFASMIEKGFLVLAASQLCMILAVPENGRIMLLLYYLIHGIGIAGINSALINMVFDYAPPEQRADSLAIVQAAMGLAGFLATLCASPLVAHIQKNGNHILGLPIYAQQFVSVIALLFTLIAYAYVHFIIIKKKR